MSLRSAEAGVLAPGSLGRKREGGELVWGENRHKC